MAATDRLFEQAQPSLRSTLRAVVFVWLPFPVLALSWWFARMALGSVATLGIVIYALINLALPYLVRHARKVHKRRVIAYLIASVVSDIILALYMLVYAGPLTLGIFPLYLVLVLKAVRYRRIALWTLIVPALLGPLYLAGLYWQSKGNWLQTEHALSLWGMIGGCALFVVLLVVIAELQLASARHVGQRFDAKQVEHFQRVAELESTNKDLRVRIRRQQALEESLRAITGVLSLDAVLSQILDSLIQMLGAPRVSAAALSLVAGDSFTHQTLSDVPGLKANSAWADALARRVLETGSAVVVGDALVEREWRVLERAGAMAALSVPLLSATSEILGALTVVSTQRHLFTTTETRHLTSFSIQASVAIHNAQLHTELTSQRLVLGAVLRDIGEALIVVDEQGTMILANPVAYNVLHHSDLHNGGLRKTLEQLNHEVRAQQEAVLARELKVAAKEHERHYLIYSSLVRLEQEGQQSPVAFILHDITKQKAQEQQRIEFISLVSHELRNPLNTLNGFIKVILAGQVGPLTDMQQEFLGLASERANELNGRITELLEFNRIEAGRLRLQPQWTNLAKLLMSINANFQLSAGDFGVTVQTEIPDTLPELLIDGGRISQVITNLIDNALKATKSGGTITVSAEACELYVQVDVKDTGVGIPLEQQQKIFQRFYRLDQNNSKHGAHLGLGLSICQQIIEGHQGRIWVVSEVGQGSCFSFTLPLVERHQMIGELVSQP